MKRHVHEAVVVESERVGHGQETVVLLPVERERVRRPVGEVAGVRVRVVLEGDAELFVDACADVAMVSRPVAREEGGRDCTRSRAARQICPETRSGRG